MCCGYDYGHSEAEITLDEIELLLKKDNTPLQNRVLNVLFLITRYRQRKRIKQLREELEKRERKRMKNMPDHELKQALTLT